MYFQCKHLDEYTLFIYNAMFNEDDRQVTKSRNGNFPMVFEHTHMYVMLKKIWSQILRVTT